MRFSALRTRLHVSPTTVIATLALVFAMTGGAYAAKKYLITSTKQISPSVLKSLKGAAGAAGANGAAGAAGPQGPAGPAGAQGPAGSKGDTGSPGKNGENGKTGPTGPTGQTGFTAVLPKGATETGAWTAQLPAKAVGDEREATAFSSISFTIPLAASLDSKHALFVAPEAVVEHCSGSVAEPEADAGYLCVYAGNPMTLVPAYRIFHDPGEEKFFAENGVGRTGAVLTFGEEPGGEGGVAFGAWAVTAP